MSIPQGQSPFASSRLRPESTEATRYLCAAAHLDEKFTQAVLEEVLYQEHRAVAPSHGISLVPIIRHALAARRRALLRDGVVSAILLIGLVASFSIGVSVILGFLAIWMLVRGFRLLAARQTAAALGYLVLAILVLPLLSLLLLTGSTLLTSGVGGLLLYGLTDQGVSPGSWPLWLAVLLLIWATYIIYRLDVHRTIAVDLTADSYRPERIPAGSSAHERRISYIEQAQVGNVTIYAQDAGGRPFIGFGEVTYQWSLVTPLQPEAVPEPLPTRPEQREAGSTRSTDEGGGPAVPFEIDELYDALRSSMAQLADPRLPPDQVIPHLSVRDRVFVAGRLPPSSFFLEQGQPRFRLSEPDLKALQHGERGRVRHYQSVRMAAWGGELEVTTFLHATTRGRMLYVEFIATVVPGIRAEYHNIDTYDRLDLAAALRAAARALGDVLQSPRALVSVATAGAHAIRRALSESSDYRRINRQLAFDYGCRSSVRELAADFVRPVRFQLYDATERINLVERRLLQALVDFLQRHHYDISELAGQVATVINNSTQINNSNTFQNSTLISSPVAAGTSASATANGTVPKPASSPAGVR